MSFRAFPWAYVLLATGMVLQGLIFHQVLNITYFSHDDLPYIADYLGKVQTEGRWLNFIFFGSLRELDGMIAWFLCWIGLYVFFWVAFYRLGFAVILSSLLALLPLQYAGLHDLLTWPNTITLSSIVLAVSALSSLRLPSSFVIPVFGALLMGSYQGFFYLLPLLFLRQTTDWRKTLTLIGVWAATFVMGYGLAYLLNAPLTGEIGIRDASWRGHSYASSLGDLLTNVKDRLLVVLRDIRLFLPNWTAFVSGASLILLGLHLLARRRINPWIIVTLIAIFFSHYGITALNGIIIQARTSFHAFAAMTVAFVVISAADRRILGVVLLIPIILSSWYISWHNLRWNSQVTQLVTRDIVQSGTVAGRLVAMDFRDDSYWDYLRRSITTEPIPGYLESRYQPGRARPAVLELGAREAVSCPIVHGWELTDRCSRLLSVPHPECRSPTCRASSGDHVLIVFADPMRSD